VMMKSTPVTVAILLVGFIRDSFLDGTDVRQLMDIS
jgi:hypothetical protein